jgi:hypothetical protein
MAVVVMITIPAPKWRGCPMCFSGVQVGKQPVREDLAVHLMQ